MTSSEDLTAVVGRLAARDGLSQRSLARKMGRSQNWLGKKMRGESDWKLSDLAELATAFGLAVPELVAMMVAEPPRAPQG